MPNKVTTDVRAAFQKLLEKNLPALESMIEETRYGKILRVVPKPDASGTVVVEGRIGADPRGAAELVLKLGEFCTPKLARTEVAGGAGEQVRFVLEVTKADSGGNGVAQKSFTAAVEDALNGRQGRH